MKELREQLAGRVIADVRMTDDERGLELVLAGVAGGAPEVTVAFLGAMVVGEVRPA